MVTILKYVFLGLLLYIFIIPLLEQLSALICQWLEGIKGKLIYKQTELQVKLDKLSEETSSSKDTVQAIGFTIPTEEEYYYEEEEEDE